MKTMTEITVQGDAQTAFEVYDGDRSAGFMLNEFYAAMLERAIVERRRKILSAAATVLRSCSNCVERKGLYCPLRGIGLADIERCNCEDYIKTDYSQRKQTE